MVEDVFSVASAPAATTPGGPGKTPPAFYPPRDGAGKDADTVASTNGAEVEGRAWIKYPPRKPVTVLLQPEEKLLELPKPKTARAVLNALGLKECTALVIREQELLTPDRAVAPGDHLIVRKVTSSG